MRQCLILWASLRARSTTPNAHNFVSLGPPSRVLRELVCNLAKYRECEALNSSRFIGITSPTYSELLESTWWNIIFVFKYLFFALKNINTCFRFITSLQLNPNKFIGISRAWWLISWGFWYINKFVGGDFTNFCISLLNFFLPGYRQLINLSIYLSFYLSIYLSVYVVSNSHLSPINQATRIHHQLFTEPNMFSFIKFDLT